VSNELYSQLKPDIEALALPLFDVSEGFIRKRGAFLPHGAVLDSSNEVKMVMALPDTENEHLSTVEVLPELHKALRARYREEELLAVAVCEDVTITPEGQKQTKAIKILVEHKLGLCVSLYLPYQRKLIGGYNFGSIFSVPANPEVLIL
jgi:hypothetical protein